MEQICPLCSGEGKLIDDRKERHYNQCTQCSGMFMDRRYWPTITDEEIRYKQHNNEVEDKRFQKFVSPITNAIQDDFTAEHVGLDFGAGTGPVITKVLSDANYQIKSYDPLFHVFPDLLNQSYDYIASCEVIEHFHDPIKEFTLLKKLLKPNGKLYCMTHLYDASVVLDNWYYMNDPTHVFIYHSDSIQWIKEHFGFKEVVVEGKLIIFSI